MPQWPPLSNRWSETARPLSPSAYRLGGRAELLAQGGQSPMQASLHGHGTHIQGSGCFSVAPSLQNNPLYHLLRAGIQTLQQLFDTHLASGLILLELTSGR